MITPVNESNAKPQPVIALYSAALARENGSATTLYRSKDGKQWTAVNIRLEPKGDFESDIDFLNKYPDCERVGIISPKGGLIVRIYDDGEIVRTPFGEDELKAALGKISPLLAPSQYRSCQTWRPVHQRPKLALA